MKLYISVTFKKSGNKEFRPVSDRWAYDSAHDSDFLVFTQSEVPLRLQLQLRLRC